MMSIEEVADALKISKQRVIQIEQVALKKIKYKLLEIDCEQNWICILMDAKEKDPFCSLYPRTPDM